MAAAVQSAPKCKVGLESNQKKSGIAQGSVKLGPGGDCSLCPRKSGTKLELLGGAVLEH